MRGATVSPPEAQQEHLADFRLDGDAWPNVQPRTKAARRRFVLEYLKDFNGTRAMLRAGYCDNADVARCQASQWVNEPYTQWLLFHELERMRETDVVHRNQVLAGLVREANHYGGDSSHGARVSALAKLATLLGMEVIKTEGKLSVTQPVMALPVVTSEEEWAAVAAFRQAKLKERASAQANGG